MYEDQTYEVILQRMLARIPANIDKREGGIIWDAMAPAAKELAALYTALDDVLKNAYADTSDREYLIMNCRTRGMSPYPAEKAVLKGVFKSETLAMDIPIGSRFSLDDLNYIATERISEGVYRMQCESAGAEGNRHFGTLVPIAYIKDLTSAELVELLIPGEDEESTEDLRERFLTSFDSLAYGGNAADYVMKIKELQGVGGVKLYRCWQGPTSVKAVILSSEFKRPTGELVDAVQEAMQPVGITGLPEIATSGTGIAPIGHVVTIEAVDNYTINVGLHLTFDKGIVFEDVQSAVREVITGYFTELAKAWERESALIVRISGIENAILTVPGVLDIAGTALNGAESNITLDADAIPLLGEVSNG